MDFLWSLGTKTIRSYARARDRLEVAKRAALGRRNNNSSNVSRRVQQVPSVRSSVLRSTPGTFAATNEKRRKGEKQRRVEPVREKIMPRGQGIIFLEAMKNVTKSQLEQQVPENRGYRSFFFLLSLFPFLLPVAVLRR